MATPNVMKTKLGHAVPCRGSRTRKQIFEVAICDRKQESRDAHFRICPVHLPQRFADFADRGVGADGVDYVGHGVGVGNIAVGASGGSLGGRLFQGIQAALDFFI